jgi:hypothetical protein
LAKRFTATHLAGIEDGIGVLNARVLRLLPARTVPVVGRPPLTSRSQASLA